MKVLVGFIFGVAATLGVLMAWTYWATESGLAPSMAPAIVPPPLPLPEVLIPRPTMPRTIYLNREGALLSAGTDDSTRNISGLLSDVGAQQVAFPAFRSSVTRWQSIVECVQGHMEPFNVTVVDQRPTRPGYVMVMVGGRADVLGTDHPHVRAAGLAPYNGDVIPDAIVMVFAQRVRNVTREVCEAAAQEIAHAYGLDHTYDCRDIMTYRRRCGRRRRFVNEDMPCGESEERACNPGGETTQNSFGRLSAVLGLREPEPPE